MSLLVQTYLLCPLLRAHMTACAQSTPLALLARCAPEVTVSKAVGGEARQAAQTAQAAQAAQDSQTAQMAQAVQAAQAAQAACHAYLSQSRCE